MILSPFLLFFYLLRDKLEVCLLATQGAQRRNAMRRTVDNKFALTVPRFSVSASALPRRFVERYRVGASSCRASCRG